MCKCPTDSDYYQLDHRKLPNKTLQKIFSSQHRPYIIHNQFEKIMKSHLNANLGFILCSSPNWFTNSQSQMHDFFNQSDCLNYTKMPRAKKINNNFSNWFKIVKIRNSGKGIWEIMGWTTELFTEQFVKAWKDKNTKMRIQRNHFTPFVTCIKIQALESIQKLNFRLGIQTKIVHPLWYFVPKIFLPYGEKKIVLVIENFFWNSRLKAEITRTIHSKSEKSQQCLVTECFFNLFLDVYHI